MGVRINYFEEPDTILQYAVFKDTAYRYFFWSLF